MNNNNTKRNTWAWVPSLYFAEGIPYVIVMTLSVIFYKRMGISNTDIALYTSWLYLPWTLKPFWSPMVDILKTKRWWIIIMQLLIGVGLAGVAFTIPVPNFFQYTLAFFWLLAFSSATHDIAADGFYMLGLSTHNQTYYIGIRSTFYRMAMLTGQGLLVILAGYFETHTGLGKVEVSVKAVHESTATIFAPDSVTVETNNKALYLVTAREIEIGTANIEKTEAAQLLDSIEKWNLSHGFYPDEKGIQEANKKEAGWWTRNISNPLANGLRSTFGKKQNSNNLSTAGNVGFTWFHLNRAPADGETIVLNFGFEKGDKSIALTKSYRYEFNSNNWNIPAFAAFQLDPKLDNAAVAYFSGRSGNIPYAWTIVFITIALVFVVFFLYHRFVLPRPETDKANIKEGENFITEYFRTFATFFTKKDVGIMLTFLMVYRLAESQLVKMASPFLLDSREMSGLGLTTGEIGLVYGTIGIVALTLGGILGGIVAARKGLKYWMWWMILAMNLPNLVYVFLSYTMPESLWVIGSSVAVEQFGYGFGFTAYMLYMIYVSEGEHKTAHFAMLTGFMALGMMIPGMLSGWLQEIIGYQHFFIWVMICTLPGFLVVPFLKIDSEFGKKSKQ